jgi:hypothetical protein
MDNQAFGTRIPTTQYASDVREGWGSSPYIWQGQVSLQQQLMPNVGLTVGYFRTSYGNIYATDNLSVTRSDFDPYCITAPSDSRLPNGGGYQVCGLYDVSRAKFGAVNNQIVFAPDNSQIFNGVDVLMNARFPRGISLRGGLATGQTVTDNCSTPDAPSIYCRQTVPWAGQTEVKFNVIYPLPFWSLQTSLNYQNLNGIPVQANYNATAAEIAPGLGRNLAACPTATGACTARVTVPLLVPNSVRENRGQQLDFRLSKKLKIGGARLQANFDIYNLTNQADVLTEQATYGAVWTQPTSILTGRLIKFSGELTF